MIWESLYESMGIFLFTSASSRIRPFSDTKLRRAVRPANGVSLACAESGRKPSSLRSICAKLGIPTSFRWSRLPCRTLALRLKGIVKISRKREAARLQTKGKKNWN